MKINFEKYNFQKEVPLNISSGEISGVENIILTLEDNEFLGMGEICSIIYISKDEMTLSLEILNDFANQFPLNGSIAETHKKAREFGVPEFALSALNNAQWDLISKRCKIPLYKMIGLSQPSIPTSVTLGITQKKDVGNQIKRLLKKSSILKVKLGSPQGIEFDKEMFLQVMQELEGTDVKVRVDANGGWSVDDALIMLKWLAEKGVEFVEQPLPVGLERELPRLYKNRPLPIFIDESCNDAEDLLQLRNCVDGVNIKLAKCGGISGALELITTAGLLKLKTMLGCMCESSLGIASAAALGSLVNYLDLDSHLNLTNDPFKGLGFDNGKIYLNEIPGAGVVR